MTKAKEEIDLWISGTEEPDWDTNSTDEGTQEMAVTESDFRMREQVGSVVSDDYVFDDEGSDDDRMIVNMGPQHPSTHGVLRLQIELEGEIIRRTKPVIGYLHTGMEKTAEELTFMQGPTNVTRMDYLAPLHNELCYSLAVERLLDIEVPPRADTIRVLLTELNRISSHLVAMATNGLDVGALSIMTYGFREREQILAFFEKTTGVRMNHNFIRPGGVAADLRAGLASRRQGNSREYPGKGARLRRHAQRESSLGRPHPRRRGRHLRRVHRLQHHRPNVAINWHRLGPAQGIPLFGH